MFLSSSLALGLSPGAMSLSIFWLTNTGTDVEIASSRMASSMVSLLLPLNCVEGNLCQSFLISNFWSQDVILPVSPCNESSKEDKVTAHFNNIF